MRTAYLFIITILLCVFQVFPQSPKKVLFLGNSYTAVNNLPGMLNQIAENMNKTLIYDSYTPGGYRFMNHANDPAVVNKVSSKDWDYVVLQGQSQETALPETQLQQDVYPYVNSLVNSIRQNNSCSMPLFYMTWGRKNGDPVNCQYVPWFCTYEGMDNHIRATYIALAEEHNAKISPVGAVWRYIRSNSMDIELYAADGSHPSLAGSYVAACAFYTVIYRDNPNQITWNSSLSPTQAENLRNAVKTVVYDSLSYWNHSLQPTADFNVALQNAQAQFTNTSEDYDALLWKFGDNSSSTEENPSHTYAENGDFTVTLIAKKCSQVDTSQQVLSVEEALFYPDFKQGAFSIFPNPIKDRLIVQWPKTFQQVQFLLYGLSGKSVLKKTVQNQKRVKFNLSNLDSGVYFLRIHTEQRTVTKKILKL